MLANIAATLKEAATFQVSSTSTNEAHFPDEAHSIDEEMLHRSKATLVLVPSHSELKIILKSRTIEDIIDLRCHLSAH